MPDRGSLRVGDRIRILRVPAQDLAAMANAMRQGRRDPQWTVRVLQRLADRRHLVRIDDIDEYHTPWFSYSFKNKANTWEHHRVAVMENDSWELVTPKSHAATGTLS